MDNTFPYLNTETGLIEIIDAVSGEVVAIQESRENLLKEKADRLVQVQMEDGRTVWLERGLDPGKVHPSKKYFYSRFTMELICQQIVEGKSLTKICQEPGMPPYRVLCRWRREHEEAEEMINQARQDRAENFHDKIIEEATERYYQRDKDGDLKRDIETGDPIEGTPSAEWIQQKKLRVDALKWAAEKGNPGRFGNTTKVINEGVATVRLIVETGIRRPEDTITEARVVEQIAPAQGEDNGIHQISSSVRQADPGGSGNTPAPSSVGGSGEESGNNISGSGE